MLEKGKRELGSLAVDTLFEICFVLDIAVIHVTGVSILVCKSNILANKVIMHFYMVKGQFLQHMFTEFLTMKQSPVAVLLLRTHVQYKYILNKQ